MKDTFKRFAIGCLSLLMVLTLGNTFFTAYAEEENVESEVTFEFDVYTKLPVDIPTDRNS